MPYSSSDYDTAVSAFNVLPESMAVENLIRLRQGNEAGAMSNRKMARDEVSELDDDVLTKSFGKHLSATANLDPESRQASTQQWMADNPSSYASKAIIAAAGQDELLRGSSARVTHRDADQSKNKLEMAKADDGLVNFDADQEMLRAENKAKLAEARARAEKFTSMNEVDADALATSESDAFAGSIQSLPLKSQQKLNEYLFATEGNPDKKIIRRNLVRLAGILEGSSQLRTAQGYLKEEHSAIKDAVVQWRGGISAVPPETAEELAAFEKRFPGKSADVLAYKQDNEAFDSADQSVKGLNRKLAGAAEETLPDGTVVPAVEGLVERLNKAQLDKSPAGRTAEAQIMGEMMSMALPAAGFVKERIRLHDSTLKSREEGLKVKKTEQEVKKLEAQIESSGNRDLLTKARTRTELNKTSLWENRNMLTWLTNSENTTKLSNLTGKELAEAQNDLLTEWDAIVETQQKMDRINPTSGSNDNDDEDPN